MANPNPKTKKIIIAIVIIILAGILYIYFSKKSNTPTSTSSLQSQSGTQTTDISLGNIEITGDTSFLSTLLSLGKTTIDPTIFSSTSFKSLQDNTVEISNDNIVGRQNPFIPFDQTIPSDNSTLLPQILPTTMITPSTLLTVPTKK